MTVYRANKRYMVREANHSEEFGLNLLADNPANTSRIKQNITQ